MSGFLHDEDVQWTLGLVGQENGRGKSVVDLEIYHEQDIPLAGHMLYSKIQDRLP